MDEIIEYLKSKNLTLVELAQIVAEVAEKEAVENLNNSGIKDICRNTEENIFYIAAKKIADENV